MILLRLRRERFMTQHIQSLKIQESCVCALCGENEITNTVTYYLIVVVGGTTFQNHAVLAIIPITSVFRYRLVPLLPRKDNRQQGIQDCNKPKATEPLHWHLIGFRGCVGGQNREKIEREIERRIAPQQQQEQRCRLCYHHFYH